MTGKSRRSSRSRRTDGAHFRLVAAMVGVATLFALCGAAPGAFGQSGRNRSQPPVTTPPQPDPGAQPQPKAIPGPQPPASDAPPAPEPAAPVRVPVPPGGVVTGQTNAGPATRYALKNGLVLVVRESPATGLVAIRF